MKIVMVNDLSPEARKQWERDFERDFDPETMELRSLQAFRARLQSHSTALTSEQALTEHIRPALAKEDRLIFPQARANRPRCPASRQGLSLCVDLFPRLPVHPSRLCVPAARLSNEPSRPALPISESEQARTIGNPDGFYRDIPKRRQVRHFLGCAAPHPWQGWQRFRFGLRIDPRESDLRHKIFLACPCGVEG